jgi:hypothetical protein
VSRIGSVRVASSGPEVPRASSSGTSSSRAGVQSLMAPLLKGSSRIMLVDPELGRVDARGWERLGGEKALGRVLLEALREAGMCGIGIGIGDVAVVADAAARLADPGPIIVPPGKGMKFLASLPLEYLPISEELQEAFRALGWRKIGQLAERDSSELETRFGPAGLEAHRWARGEDERTFHACPPPERREVSLEFENPATALEPLLFALRPDRWTVRIRVPASPDAGWRQMSGGDRPAGAADPS